MGTNSTKSRDPSRLGQAEIGRGGTVWMRLSRKVDPTLRRIELTDARARELLDEPLSDLPELALEQGRRGAHALSVRALETKRVVPRTPTVKTTGTVETWCNDWHKDRVRRGIVVSSRYDCGHLNEHVLPSIRKLAMAKVSRDDIEAIVRELDRKIVEGLLSWKTAANVWGTLSKMFDDARRSKNPGLRVRTDDPTIDVEPPERGEAKQKQFLYPCEYVQLATSPAIWQATGRRVHAARGARRWMRAFTLAIYLEPRAGELRSLRWPDIDLVHWTCRIARATKRDTGGKEEKSTKTGMSRRFVVEPALRPLLLVMHAESDGKGRVINLPHEGDLSERLRRYCEWAGVDRCELHTSGHDHAPITFRDLRATGITWRALRGDEPLKIQRAAGHKSLNTTQGYIRVAEDVASVAGRPFPTVPLCVVGRELTTAEEDRLEAASEGLIHADPFSDPQNGNYARSQRMVASPAGFEPTSVVKLPRNARRNGAFDPRDATEGYVSRGARGSVAAALERALTEAISEGRTTDAAQLATELAARANAVAAPNVVALPVRRR